MGILDNWVDLVAIILLALALLRGFIRGFTREVFGLIGMAAAVVAGLSWYRELAGYAAAAYGLSEGQAQILAFSVIVLAVGLVAALITHMGVRIIRLTPFSLVDRLAGAAFGGFKILLLLLIVISVLLSLGVPAIDAVLDDSLLADQIALLQPLAYRYAEEWWPAAWEKPAWLFPGPPEPLEYTNFPR